MNDMDAKLKGIAKELAGISGRLQALITALHAELGMKANFTPESVKSTAPGWKQVPAGWRDTCAVLRSKVPETKSEWTKVLFDFGDKATLNEKQWKFFCVMHKECLGTWPKERFEELKGEEPGAYQGKKAEPIITEVPTPDDFEVPF